MKKLLLLSASVLAVTAGSASADPLTGALALALGGGATALAVAQVVVGLGVNLIAGALTKAMMGKPKINVNFETKVGDDLPLTFVVGDYVTAGKRKYINSWGPNTRYIVEVFEVSALPQPGTPELWLNDEPGTVLWNETTTITDRKVIGYDTRVSENGDHTVRTPIYSTTTTTLGHPITNFDGGPHPTVNRMWIKWVDGSQTVVDPYLKQVFGGHPDHPWSDDMVGTGKTYAVVTTQYDSNTMTQVPTILFKPPPLRLYDPRKDSTAGGAGTHRWGVPSTYEVTRNNAVIAYNIARGIYYGTEWVFGGQNLAAWRLPVTEWAVAMNACDANITLADGKLEPSYRGGAEVSVDMEPLAVMEQLGLAANMRFAEVGGRLKPLIGLPAASVFSFTDGDLITTAGQTLQPFAPLAQTFNSITGAYPEPGQRWKNKDAPEFQVDGWLARDGQYLPMAVTYAAAPYQFQVQRLMRAQLLDAQRVIVHEFALPPMAYAIEPLDLVTWSSDRNGYINKTFLVEAVTKLAGMGVQVVLKEVDPSDYDWTAALQKPTSVVAPTVGAPVYEAVTSFTVAGTVAEDNTGAARLAAVEITCSGDIAGVDRLRIQIRKNGATDPTVDVIRPFAEPYRWVVTGVAPATTYYARVLPLSPYSSGIWTSEIAVTTPQIVVPLSQLAIDVTNAIAAAAGSAAGDVLAAQVARDAAIVAKDAAVAAQGLAVTAKNDAQTAFTAADAAKTAALGAQTAATAAKTLAETAKTNAETAFAAADAAKTAALASQTAAAGSATAASGFASTASTQSTAAGNSATAAAASATAANTSAGSASTSASQAATSASGALGSANSAATSATTSAAVLTDTQRALAAASTIVAGKASTALLPYGSAAAGTVDSFAVFSAANYGSDVDGAYLNRSSATAFFGGFLRAVAPSTDGNVYRITAKVKATAANVASIVAAWINSDGTVNASAGYLNTAVSAGAFTTLTMILGRTGGGLVTQTGGTLAVWNAASYIRFGVRTNNAAAGQFLQIYDIQVDDLTAADAAARQATAALAAADAAATSATAASASQTAAGTSASAAATSATNANTSAGTAGTSATAASNSATAAAGSASAAATSATNAAGSASTAGTQATAAGTQASNAATSASNAATSASSAQSALVSARLSVTNAPVLPYDFTDGVVHWTRGRAGSPALMADPSAATIVTDPGLGQAIELGFNDSGATASLMTKGAVTLVSGRVYRVTVKFKLYAATNPITIGMFCQLMDGGYVATTSTTQLSTALTASTTTVVTFTRTFSDVAMAGVDTVLAAFGTSQYARFGLRRTTAGASGDDTMRIGLVQVQDVTQEVLAAGAALTAGDAASAASGSATLAGTKADAAGVSATAASASANTATTQAGNASTSASAAATSASTALGHSNSAATSATTAASTQQAVDRAASALFPRDFTEDARFFTSLQQNAPDNRPDLAAPWAFSTDATEGRMVSLSAPQASDRVMCPKGYIAGVAGRSYRITIRARHRGAFVGSSATALLLRFRGVTSAFVAGTLLTPQVYQTFAAVNTWYDFSLTVVNPGTDPFLSPMVLIASARFNGTAGPIIDVSKVIIEDVTDSLAAAGSASAAVDAQTAASASQTAAANSASAASLSAIAANSSAGGAAGSATAAGTSASNAAGSESNALGSAGAAATSALTASNSSNAAVVAVAQGFPVDFVTDGLFYQSAASGAPAAATALTGNFNFVTDGTNGRCYQITPLTAGDLTAANTKGVVNPTVGRRFRLTVRARYSGTVTSPSLSLRIIRLDSAYDTPTVVAILNSATLTTTMASYTLEYTAVAADTYLRFGIVKPTAAAGAGTILVQSMVVEDITSETAASGSASAAAGSASTATTQAGNAGNSATAANNSVTAASGHADTALGHAAAANTASISASAAKVDAEGASASALEYRNAAARMTAGGVSKNPVLNSWTGAVPDNLTVFTGGTSSTAKVTAGVRYVNAIDLIGSDTTQSRPILRLGTVVNTLDCVPTPEKIVIRAELELVSGTIAGGATIQITWSNGTGGTPVTFTKLLSDSMLDTVAKIQTVEWYVERPAGFVLGTNPYMNVDLYAISNVLGATRAAATLRVHRFDFEVVTADSMAEIFQRAKVAVDGIQSAAIGLRAVAGSAGALLELVALDDPQGGSASVARIAASNIILAGSVLAEHLTVGAGVNLINNSDFAMGLTHWGLTGSGAVLTNSALSLRSGGISYSAYGKDTITLVTTPFTQTGEAIVQYVPAYANGQTQYGIPVVAAQYYEFSAQLSLHRLNAGQLQIEWINISGVTVSTSVLVSLPVTATSSSVDPDLWPRYGAVAQAPAGAAYARPRFRHAGVQTGQTNTYLFAFKPFFGASKVGAALSPYSTGGQTIIDGGLIVTDNLVVTESMIVAGAVSRVAVASGSGVYVTDTVGNNFGLFTFNPATPYTGAHPTVMSVAGSLAAFGPVATSAWVMFQRKPLVGGVWTDTRQWGIFAPANGIANFSFQYIDLGADMFLQDYQYRFEARLTPGGTPFLIDSVDILVQQVSR